jgi:hypothetical protein
MEDLNSKMEIYPPGHEHPLPAVETRRQRLKRRVGEFGLIVLSLLAFAAELAPFVISFTR